MTPSFPAHPQMSVKALSFIWISLIIMQLLLLHIQNGVLNPIKWAMCCKGVGKHDWRQSLGWQTRAIWARWKTTCCEVNGRLCDDHWWSSGWRCMCVWQRHRQIEWIKGKVWMRETKSNMESWVWVKTYTCQIHREEVTIFIEHLTNSLKSEANDY